MGKDTTFILNAINIVIAVGFILYILFIVLIQTYESFSDVGQSIDMFFVFLAFFVIVFFEIHVTSIIWWKPLVGGIGFILLGLIWLKFWSLNRWESLVPMTWIISTLLANFGCGALSLVIWRMEKAKIPHRNTQYPS